MFTKWTQVKDIINFACYTFVSKFFDGKVDLFGKLTETVRPRNANEQQAGKDV